MDELTKDFFNYTVETTKDVFMKQGGKINPAMCIMLTRNGGLEIMPIPIMGSKDLIAAVIKARAQMVQPIAMSFITEAYMVQIPSEGVDIKKHIKEMIPPSEHPDRKEILMITNETKLIVRSTTIDILRDNKGAAFLGSIINRDLAQIEGRFTHLLCDPLSKN